MKINEVIGTLSKPNKSPQETISCIQNFLSDLNIWTFSELDENLQIEFFRQVWCSFFSVAMSKNENIKLSAFSVATSFLLRFAPYYAHLLCQTFSDILNEHDSNETSSAIIVAAFSFLTNFIEPEYLSIFLQSTPIFHHFFMAQSLSSERLASIISNIPWMGDEWFTTFFCAFIHQCLKTEARNIYSATLAIFNRNPVHLTKVLVQFGDDEKWGEKYMSLLSYLLPCGNVDLSNDFSGAQSSAFKLVSDESVSKTTKLNCFIVLSYLSDKLSIAKEDEKIAISLNEQKVLLDYKDYASDPSFFLLPLPWDLLKPCENDSQTIMSAKLESIGRMAATSKDEEVIMRTISLLNDYGDKCHFSSILGCIAKCANNIILHEKGNEFSAVLFNNLFCKELSWYHCLEIMNTLMAIDINLYVKAFGYNGPELVYKRVIEFAKNKNQGFAEEARKSLIKLSDHFFFEITNQVAHEIDFFDNASINVHLKILNDIIAAHLDEDISHLRFVGDVLFEIGIIPNMALITQVFLFLSFFDNSEYRFKALADLVGVAVVIVKTTCALFAGTKSKLSFSDEISEEFHALTEQFFDHHSIDITETSSGDLKVQFAPVYAATKFILSLPFGVVDRNFLTMVCQRLFRFFPGICTDFMILRFNEFNENERITLVNQLHGVVRQVPLPHAHAQWSKIALFPMNPGKLPRDFLNEVAKDSLFFIKNPGNVDAEDLHSFVAFLGVFNHKYDKEIREFLNAKDPEFCHMFLTLPNENFSELEKSFREEIAMMREIDSENATTFKLRELLKKRVNTPEEIEFLRTNLKGREAEIFNARITPVSYDKMTYNQRIEYACNTNDPQLLEKFINIGIIKHEEFDFSKVFVPTNCVPVVCRHLKKNKKNDQMRVILDKFDFSCIGRDGEDGYLCTASEYVDDFCKAFLSIDKIKTKHLMFLLRVIIQCEDPAPIEGVVLQILQKNFSESKQNLIAIVVSVLCHKLKKSKDIRTDFFEYARKVKCVDPCYLVRAIYAVAGFANFTDEQINFAKMINNNKYPSLSTLGFLNQSMIICNSRRKQRIKADVCSIVHLFIAKGMPSSLLCALRLATQCIVSLPAEDTIVCLKNSISSLIEACFVNTFNQPVINAASKMMQHILKNEELRVFHSIVADSFTSICSSKMSASVLILVSYVGPHLMKIAGLQSFLFKYLTNLMDNLSFTSSYPLFEISTSILEALLNRYNSPSKQQAILVEKANKWLSERYDLDAYEVDKFYDVWRRLLIQFKAYKGLDEIVGEKYNNIIIRQQFEMLMLARTLKDIKGLESSIVGNFTESVIIMQAKVSDKKVKESISCVLADDCIGAIDILFN